MKIAHAAAVAIVSCSSLCGCSLAGVPAIPPGDGAARAVAPFHEPIDAQAVISIANFGGSDILGFPLNARGNTPPIVDLGGPKTEFSNPTTVGVDASGTQYTLLRTFDAGRTRIGEFAGGSTGDVSPTRTITDAIASHHGRLVTSDPAGTIFLLYLDSNSDSGIDVFAPGSHGVVMPSREIAGHKTLMDTQETIVSLFADTSGAVWWACDGEVGIPRVVGFAPHANGDVAPAVVLPSDPITQIVAPTFAGVDALGEVFVNSVGANPAVQVFAKGATGDVSPIRATQLPANFYLMTVYKMVLVAEGIHGLDNPAIGVFSAKASGPQRPLRLITGHKTKLNQPAGVAIN
jgi:hypothetical protein